MKRTLFCLMIATASKEAITQNVGIGTTAPTEKLQVTGNIKADTVKPNAIKLTPNAGNGRVLTSDANGNASWQSRVAADGNIGYGVWGDCATNGNLSGYQPVDDSSAAAGNSFGQSLSVSGEFAVIGNWGENVNGNSSQGTATIYKYNGSNWEFFQKITDPTGAAGDRFGESVSISGNFLVCGAYMDDVGANASQGSVSVFRYNGSSWVFAQKITDPIGSAGDYFGENLCISGNFMIIGAYFDDNGSALNRGSVSFYRYNGSSWILLNKAFDPDGAELDFFGGRVSISGDYAVAAAFGDDDTFEDQGSVTIYKFNGINSFVRLEKIYDNTPAVNEEFGRAVSNAGSDIFVGAYQENGYKGKVSYYRYINNTFQRLQSFLSVSTEVGSTSFGYSVCASGNYLLVGSPQRNFDPEDNVGELMLYQRIGNYYYKMQSIRDPGAIANSQFGGQVAIDATSKHFIGSNYVNSPTSKVVFGRIN